MDNNEKVVEFKTDEMLPPVMPETPDITETNETGEEEMQLDNELIANSIVEIVQELELMTQKIIQLSEIVGNLQRGQDDLSKIAIDIIGMLADLKHPKAMSMYGIMKNWQNKKAKIEAKTEVKH